jgi:hypothetical protein
LAAERSKGFAQEFFVGEWPVKLIFRVPSHLACFSMLYRQPKLVDRTVS